MTNYVSSFANGAAVDAEITKVANSNLSATHKITRSATLVIAASDSSAKSKAQADYVCDGTNDEVEIQAAITALPAMGGSILFLEGNYSKGAAAGITIPSNTNIILSSGATITLANSINADACIFTNSDAVNGNRNISITGHGILRGNEANQTTGNMFAISLTKCIDCSIDCFAEDFTYADRQLIDCTNVSFINRFYALPDEYGEDKTVIVDCQSTTGWSPNDCTLAVDDTISMYGINSIKSTVNAGKTRHLIYITLANAIDLSKHQFEFYFYIPDANYISNLTVGNSIDIRFRESTSTRYAAAPGLKYVAHLGNGWHCITLSKGAFNFVSNFVEGDWKNIKRVDISITGLPEGSEVWFGGLFALKMPQEGANIVTFDDATSNQYDVAKNYLSKYNMPATVFIVPKDIGSATFLTWDKIKALESLGWDIGSHTLNHNSMTTSDAPHVKYELDGSITTICSLGFKNGIRFFANPQGDIPAFNTANDNLVRSRFVSSRAIGDQTYILPIPYDIAVYPRHPMTSFSIRSNTVQTDIYASVKRAKKYKSYAVWNLHNVATGLDISEANFDSMLSYIKNTAALPTKTLSDVFNIGTPIKMSYTERNVSDFYSNCLAAAATRICNAVSLNSELPSTFALATQPDIPRALTATVLHSNITAYTIVISGLNAKGESVTETFTESSGWTWTTSHAYSKITSIIMTARTGTGVDDTISIGTTDKIGLSNPIYLVTDIYKIKKNSTDLAVDPTKIDTVYSTYDLSSSAISDTDTLTVWYLSKYSKVI